MDEAERLARRVLAVPDDASTEIDCNLVARPAYTFYERPENEDRRIVGFNAEMVPVVRLRLGRGYIYAAYSHMANTLILDKGEGQ